VIVETEDELIKRLNEWKDNVENKGMRVNMNKTNVMINAELQKVTQKAVRWPCGVCGRGTHTLNHSTALWILSDTTQVSRYQKKHPHTHTYCGDQ